LPLGTGPIRLLEDRAHRSRHHRRGGLGHQGQRIAHEVHHPNAIRRLRGTVTVPFVSTAKPLIARRRSDAQVL
jgi:hypothetical protein